VYDSAVGLTKLNISLGNVKLDLAALVSNLGLNWQEASDVASFSCPQLYYAPAKPPQQSSELFVSAVADLPLLGLAGVSGSLLVGAEGNLSLQVSWVEGLHGIRTRA
jgi:hypothetical protein